MPCNEWEHCHLKKGTCLSLTFQNNLAMTKLHVQGVEANDISCTNLSMTLSSFVRLLWKWNNVASKY